MKTWLLAGLLLGTSAFAQSNETTGGGLGVYTNTGFKLYDLVDPTTCTWQSGVDLLTGQAEVQGYLEKIKKLNWYLEMKLRSEIQAIDFCWTKAYLKEPKTGTPPELMIYQKLDHVPVGIRLFNAKAVYAQSDRYTELGPSDKALFIIHEALHSFIPLNTMDRYHALENMVVSISKIQGDPARESRSFNTTIKRSHLTIPSDVNFISDQEFLQYVFANYEDRRIMVLSGDIQQNELMRKREYEYMKSLSVEDQDYLNQVKGNLQAELMGEFCKTADHEVINKLQISIYCMSMPGYLNRTINNRAQDMQVLKRYIAEFYQDLSPIIPSIKKNRVVVSKNIDILSANPAINPQYRYALDVKPAFQSMKLDDAHPHLLQYAKTIVALASIQTVDEWITTIDAESALVKVLNFKSLQSALEQLHSPIEDETGESILNLKAVYLGVAKGLVQMLRDENLNDHADRLIKLINEKNLGIKIGE